MERVKRSVLCNSKENGGLGMIDLECFQQSFLLRSAVLWQKNAYAGNEIVQETQKTKMALYVFLL